MFEFTRIPPEKIKTANEITSIQSLDVQNLSFRFAGRKQLLKNIFFTVKKGEIIAIMGENGCGKSTLSQILQSTISSIFLQLFKFIGYYHNIILNSAVAQNLQKNGSFEV